jgi:hypothetical protein
MEKPTYNLTKWQRFGLFFLKPYWWLSTSPNKKSWHLVKRGLEKHEHKFTQQKIMSGYRFMKCEHEGCNLFEPID